MKKSVDVISIDKWSTGYHRETDSVILSFEFDDVEEPLALSMSRDLAGLIGAALMQLNNIEPPHSSDLN